MYLSVRVARMWRWDLDLYQDEHQLDLGWPCTGADVQEVDYQSQAGGERQEVRAVRQR